MTKRAPKKAAPGPTVTLADVTEGDTAVLESGASVVGCRNVRTMLRPMPDPR